MDIDFALIGDYADIVNGKLYLMGGGWDTFHAQQEPAQVRLSLAVGVRFGWEETNQAVPVRITIEDDDGKELLRADGAVNVGRPPTLPPGSTQLAQMAANLALAVPRFGGYRIRISAGPVERPVERLLPFRVVQTRPA